MSGTQPDLARASSAPTTGTAPATTTAPDLHKATLASTLRGGRRVLRLRYRLQAGLLHKGRLQRHVPALVRPAADLAPAARARLVHPAQVLGAAAAGGGVAARRKAHLARGWG